MYASPGLIVRVETTDVKKMESDPEGVNVMVPVPRFFKKYMAPREEATVGRVHVTLPPELI